MIPDHVDSVDSSGTATSLLKTTERITVTILASSLALANAQYAWRKHALCRDTDPDLFFPVGTTGQALIQIDRAKEVCDQCLAKPDCLEFALETNQDSGIWGGTSEEERRKLRREYVARQKGQTQNITATAV